MFEIKKNLDNSVDLFFYFKEFDTTISINLKKETAIEFEKKLKKILE